MIRVVPPPALLLLLSVVVIAEGRFDVSFSVVGATDTRECSPPSLPWAQPPSIRDTLVWSQTGHKLAIHEIEKVRVIVVVVVLHIVSKRSTAHSNRDCTSPSPVSTPANDRPYLVQGESSSLRP